MKIYSYLSTRQPIERGNVILPYRGYDISLSNLIGAGEIHVFRRIKGEYGRQEQALGIHYSPRPSAAGLRNVMTKIDAFLDQ